MNKEEINQVILFYQNEQWRIGGKIKGVKKMKSEMFKEDFPKHSHLCNDM